MVTDEERDYMYAEYAKDPRMRANVGIRRRLAPLLENDRNQIELFTAMLLSLPGSPVISTATEIGMATSSGSATVMGCAPQCGGRRTATPGSPAPTPDGSTFRPTSTRTASPSVNVEAQRDSSNSPAELDANHACRPPPA